MNYLSDHPELAAQFHPELNGDLTPESISERSGIKVYWLLPYDDPATGAHYDFVWQARVCDRVLDENGCPYLAGKKVWAGFNDLRTKYPEIAAQWHPTKNGDLSPEKVTAGSSKVLSHL